MDNKDCVPCGAGESSPDRSTVCVNCRLGKANAQPGGLCGECEDGEYANEVGSTFCLPCTGFSQLASGVTNVHAYTLYGLHSECQMCSTDGEGRMLAVNEAKTGCRLCTSGKYVDRLRPGCSSCLEGKTNTLDFSACRLCPPGKSRGFGDVDCVDCVAGRYSSVNPSSPPVSCSLCPAGQTSLAGASGCTDCPAGSRSSFQDSLCTFCERGTYSGPGAMVCPTCDPGESSDNTYELDGVTVKKGPTYCDPCEAGKAREENLCVDCRAGRYSGDGAFECTLCCEFRPVSVP